MALINFPNKVVGSQLTADEANLLKNGVNLTYEEALAPSHGFAEEYFKIDGTLVGPNNEPIDRIVLNLNPAHFEIVNGMVSIKASLLA